MRFILTIELGNETMQTAADIRRALVRASQSITGHKPKDGDSGAIRDENGNRVGGWHVEETE